MQDKKYRIRFLSSLTIYAVRTRKLWNRKTKLYQYLSVFDDVTKQVAY